MPASTGAYRPLRADTTAARTDAVQIGAWAALRTCIASAESNPKHDASRSAYWINVDLQQHYFFAA
jgi:hypothetical protein